MKVNEILEYLSNEGFSLECHGMADVNIYSYAALDSLMNGSISWIKGGKHIDLNNVKGKKDIVLIASEKTNDLPDEICQIITNNPKAAFFSVIKRFFGKNTPRMISPHSIVESSVVGMNVGIGHFSYIGKDVEIGDDVSIGNNVSIECPCKIGAHSRIGSGTVIGTDGYGYYKDNNGIQQRVPHTGGVVIGEYVEIDANVCIDRGTIGDTIIGDYVKIDNFVQIAHNDNIAPHSMIISHSVIAGSVKVGDHAYIAPGAIVLNQKKVGANSMVGAGSVVIGNVKEGKVVSGNPAVVLWDNT